MCHPSSKYFSQVFFIICIFHKFCLFLKEYVSLFVYGSNKYVSQVTFLKFSVQLCTLLKFSGSS